MAFSMKCSWCCAAKFWQDVYAAILGFQTIVRLNCRDEIVAQAAYIWQVTQVAVLSQDDRDGSRLSFHPL